MSLFDAVKVDEDDKESGEAAADLNADDSPGLRFWKLLQGVLSCRPLLYQSA
jgi:hypothetical protein